MKKLFRLINMLFLIGIICSCQIKDDMVRFQPVEYNIQAEAFYRTNEYSEEFEQTFIKVLDFFKEEYEYKNGILFINRKLNDDEEWLWNLCRKSKDPSWIELMTNIQG